MTKQKENNIVINYPRNPFLWLSVLLIGTALFEWWSLFAPVSDDSEVEFVRTTASIVMLLSLVIIVCSVRFIVVKSELWKRLASVIYIFVSLALVVLGCYSWVASSFTWGS